MTTAPRSLWAGRGLALVGIMLVALNVRTAVVAVSPIVRLVGADIPLDSVGIGLIGMLPPVAFALSGVFAPFVAHRLGLETTLVVACAAMAAGTALRSVVSDFPLFFIGSVIALTGMGFGNILLPPAVKKYFPDRIGLVSAIYVTLVSVSAGVPPVVAVPVAEAAGWRVSVGSWAVLAVLALAPWAVLGLRARLARRRARLSLDPAVEEAEPAVIGRLWRSPTAWAITLTCGLSSMNFYSMAAWLPELMISRGESQVTAATMLSLFAMVGIPLGFIVPWTMTRMRSSIGPLVVFGSLSVVASYLGLMFDQGTWLAWVWVFLAGVGTLLFPLSLTLINLRTRSHQASTALSGFVQGIGYTIAAAGPLLVGLLYELTGDWYVPLSIVIVAGALVLGCAAVLARGRFVEDEGVRAT